MLDGKTAGTAGTTPLPQQCSSPYSAAMAGPASTTPKSRMCDGVQDIISHPTHSPRSSRLSLSTSRASDFNTRLRNTHPNVEFSFFVSDMILVWYSETRQNGRYLLHWVEPATPVKTDDMAWRARTITLSPQDRQSIEDIPDDAFVLFLDPHMRQLRGYGFQGDQGIRIGDHVRTANNDEFVGGGVLTYEIVMCSSGGVKWTLIPARGWIQARDERFWRPGTFYVACTFNLMSPSKADDEAPTQWLIGPSE
jgi:hypothetical protein